LIDLHLHVLPGIDDGPATVEEAVAMARVARDAGATTLVGTPHVDRFYSPEPDAILAAREELAGALAEEGVEIEILTGAEIALERLVDLDDAHLEAYALGTSRTLLVECPLESAAGEFTWPIRRALEGDWCVLLGHPERSPAFQRDSALLIEMVEAGARTQVTAGALAGDFGGVPRAAALSMLEANLVHVISSDAHDAGARGPDPAPGRAAFLAEWPGAEARWAWLTRVAPSAILAGLPVPARLPAVA
jgi:protein-tyrosine phosphatase